jgi:deoxyribodipyrimidine photolyase
MPSKALVWFKRDLRLHDHAPLCEAVLCDEALALYIIEPQCLSSEEFDSQHLDFVLRSLAPLQATLAQRGLALWVRVGGATRLPICSATRKPAQAGRIHVTLKSVAGAKKRGSHGMSGHKRVLYAPTVRALVGPNAGLSG